MAILGLITLLIINHFFIDFLTQTSWMYLNKGKYGHWGGIMHATEHGVSSWLVTYVFCILVYKGDQDMTMYITLALGLLNAVLHYHIDWFKVWYNTKKHYSFYTEEYWVMLGIDQMLHKLTYVGMAAIILAFVPNAHANPIDDNCPQFVKTPAPVSTAADVYICHKAYAIAYDTVHKIPVYTVHRISPDTLTHSVPRSNSFRADPAVVRTKEAAVADYKGSPYAKGHMTPDDDMDYSVDTERESFFMTNMTPQLSNINSGVWRSVERYGRISSLRIGGAYVITGSVYDSSSSTIGKGVTIPNKLWKVYIFDNGVVECFVVSNNGSSQTLQGSRSSIQEISKLTGLKFY